MSAIVKIESAGSHSFNMPHLRRSGAEELIQMLLEKASYYEEFVWRVRINEKQQCSGMTQPISVVRYSDWGVYVRIKPGDNNTCHSVTIILPEGYKANEVYHKLKTVEKSFNRNWRKVESIVPVFNGSSHINGVGDEASDSLVVVPQEGELHEIYTEVVVESIENQRFDVPSFMAKSDNIKSICLCIKTMERSESFKEITQFMHHLCKNLGISVIGRQGGAMMRSMMNRGLVKKTFDGVRHVGYTLTRKGKDLIKDEIPIPEPQPEKGGVPVVTLKVDAKGGDERRKLLCDIGPIARDISHAAARIKEIDEERQEHQRKIEALNKEEQELCDLVDSEEIERLLLSLVDVKLKPK